MPAGPKTLPISERFWPKVNKTSTCWEWVAAKKGKGYGLLWDNDRRWMRSAHHVSWEIHNGPIPDGLWVLHTCDNPSCVNPDHLWLGTSSDNAKDRDSKGRRGTNGIHNGSAKLNPKKVREIRRRVKAGEKQVSLAREFGVSKATLCSAVNGETWI